MYSLLPEPPELAETQGEHDQEQTRQGSQVEAPGWQNPGCSLPWGTLESIEPTFLSVGVIAGNGMKDTVGW